MWPEAGLTEERIYSREIEAKWRYHNKGKSKRREKMAPKGPEEEGMKRTININSLKFSEGLEAARVGVSGCRLTG